MDAQSGKLLGQIIRSARLASLGTLRDGAPFVSLVGFLAARDFSVFYILLNRLSQHALDIQKDKRVNLMITEIDDGRSNPLSLARVSIRGVAEFFPSGEPGFTPVQKSYIARYPEAEVSFKLKDNELWRILPKGARYVAGINKAFNLTPDGLKKNAR